MHGYVKVRHQVSYLQYCCTEYVITLSPLVLVSIHINIYLFKVANLWKCKGETPEVKQLIAPIILLSLSQHEHIYIYVHLLRIQQKEIDRQRNKEKDICRYGYKDKIDSLLINHYQKRNSPRLIHLRAKVKDRIKICD